MTVLSYVESVYSETKFEYLSYLDVIRQFPDKEDARRQLNELLENGTVKKRRGVLVNILIEYTGHLRTEFETKNLLK
jgi:hypothetical protein